MDTVINRLSDIEKAAVSVMDGASERKKQMAREMEEKTAAFDAQLMIFRLWFSESASAGCPLIRTFPF